MGIGENILIWKAKGTPFERFSPKWKCSITIDLKQMYIDVARCV
jgi:hypothetical protein